MKRSDQDQLLKELLGGENLEGFREKSLEGALTLHRERQRRRRMARSGSLALAAITVLLAVALQWNGRHGSTDTLQGPGSVQHADSGVVKRISDEELLALFPDRPVALIGKPGNQRLVFLGQAAGSTENPEL